MTKGETATGSICPKNWHLPIGAEGVSNDFYVMTHFYGDADNEADWTTSLMQKPVPGFILSGLLYGTMMGSVGNGVFWSAMAADNAGSYRLHINGTESKVHLNSPSERYQGASVRCLTGPSE